LSILVWFSLFPPSGNPVIGEEHMAFAFSLLLFDVLACWQSIRLGPLVGGTHPSLLH